MMKTFGVLSSALILTQESVHGSDTHTNGNVAFTLTKEYIENHQDIFQRYLIKETEEMALRDVRVQTKIQKGRLTTLMSSVQLADFNLEQAEFTIDFISKAAPEGSE